MQALKPTYNMCCMRVFLDVKLHKIGLYVYTPAWLYMYVYIYTCMYTDDKHHIWMSTRPV